MKRFAVLALVVLLPTSAAALESPFGESERDWTLGFRMGSYQPNIDDQFQIPEGQQGPYETVFGNDGALMIMFGFDYHVIRDYGTLSVGSLFGLWSDEGRGISTGEATDKTEMSMYPLLLQVTYKLDMWQDLVPVVPVVRIGADVYIWEITDGSGDTARFGSGDEAAGGTFGWHYTLGVYLLLDFLARDMAIDFDRDAGVNNSYLTAEYHSAFVDDFGSDDSFRLGGDSFFFGLALDL